MSARMQVPLSQRRHTNVAAVRYTKNGVKLEIACYKNKVISYRNGVETRLDEVLQIDRVFTNISRGLYASEKDIRAVFGDGTTEEEALKYILVHGELQVAQHEREVEVNQMFTDIALIISQKCLNKVNQRPFPAQVIEQALRSIGATVKLDQPVKKQALTLIHKLIDSQVIPIDRAPMKIRCNAPDEPSLNKVAEWCKGNNATIVEETRDPCRSDTVQEAGRHTLLILLQPHLFRGLENFVNNEMSAKAAVHMVDSVAMDVGEVGVMDADSITQANAHATVAGKPDEWGGLSQQTGSSSGPQMHTSGQGKRKGAKNQKQKCGKHEDQEFEKVVESSERQNTTIAADLPPTSCVTGDGSEDFDVREALSKLGLDSACGGNAYSDGDSDDNKKRRGKKKGKGRQGGRQQLQQNAPKKGEEKVNADSDSDEEVLVNRKQRKMAAGKAKDDNKNRDRSFDDEYDYGDEDEEN